MLNPAALGPLYEAAKKAVDAGMVPSADSFPNRTKTEVSEASTAIRDAITLAESPSPVGGAQRWAMLMDEDIDGDPVVDPIMSPDGRFVLHTDYAVLSAELAEVRVVLAEDYAKAVRDACGACGGTGVGGCSNGPGGEPEPYECEYCGRPMQAIRAAALETITGHADAVRAVAEAKPMKAELAEAKEAVQWLVRSAACLHNFHRAEDGEEREWYQAEANRANDECRKFEVVRKAMETYSPAALARAATVKGGK